MVKRHNPLANHHFKTPACGKRRSGAPLSGGQSVEISRRGAAQQIGAYTAGLFSMPMLLSLSRAHAAPKNGHPTAFVWAGYDNINFFPDYAEAYGRGPNFSLFGDEEEAFQKMRSGFSPDFILPCSYVIRRWHDAGLLGAIDTDKLSHWPDLLPRLKTLPGSVIDGKRVFVPTDWGLTSVVYRTDIAPEYIGRESYGILWDKKYRGRLAMIDSQIDSVTVAALYAGLDPFNLSSEEIETVRRVLQQQRSLLRMYTSDNSAIVHALASGEVVAALAWSSDYADLKEAGIPVAFMTPKEGRMAWVCGAGIHANSLYREKAHKLIDSMISPQGGAFAIRENGTGVANRKAFDLVEDGELNRLGLSRDPESQIDGSVFQVEQKNAHDIAVMFEEVKLGL